MMNSINIEKSLGIFRIDKDSPRYPPLLREIYDPPLYLYCRGNLPDPEKSSVALVGTRHPSAAASRHALALGRDFARMGITVISGLALGIDALAHRGALEGARDLQARIFDSSTSILSSGYAGCTVAVLGSSVDEVYPASNRELARRILKAGGSLLSEYNPGTTPRKSYYPQRNRIISGLARATVIVEAPEHSGALITGKFALEQGRDLYVASSGVSSSIGKGTRSLAVEGCPVISSAAEILSEWGIDTSLLQKWDEQNRRNGGSLNSLSLTASLKKELGL